MHPYVSERASKQEVRIGNADINNYILHKARTVKEKATQSSSDRGRFFPAYIIIPFSVFTLSNLSPLTLAIPTWPRHLDSSLNENKKKNSPNRVNYNFIPNNKNE